MKNYKRRIIDATLEPCSRHPVRSRFRRLCNHAYRKKERKKRLKMQSSSRRFVLRQVTLCSGI